MIVTKIVGGLGNQMFQYAAGLALSLRKNLDFALDISAFGSYSLHQGFELERVFACKAHQINQAQVNKLVGWQGSSLGYRLMARKDMAFLRSKCLVIEPHFEYWPGINDLPDDCLLSGYWQSERYFAHSADQIRTDFSFAQPPSAENLVLIERISSANAISLHLRRGDYINNPVNASIYAMCSLEYYQNAIKLIAKQVRDPHFFIFSDDMAWVKAHLVIDFPVEYVDHNRGVNSYNDMRLMSLCKHNIIANSSFSWWGAWLNRFEEKIIVAPKLWFVNQTNSEDLLPESWVKL